MRPADEPDDLDLELPAMAANSAFKDRLRHETSRLTRRRRQWAKGATWARMAACYVAGLGTMWGATAWLATPTVAPIAAVPAKPEPATKQDEIVDRQWPKFVEQDDARAPAYSLEKRAWASTGDDRQALFKKAAGRYRTEGDLAGATRCYSQYLDEQESAGSTSASEEDSDWLLSALKLDRQREKRNASDNG